MSNLVTTTEGLAGGKKKYSLKLSGGSTRKSRRAKYKTMTQKQFFKLANYYEKHGQMHKRQVMLEKEFLRLTKLKKMKKRRSRRSNF